MATKVSWRMVFNYTYFIEFNWLIQNTIYTVKNMIILYIALKFVTFKLVVLKEWNNLNFWP